MNKLIPAIILSATAAATQAAEVQKISFLECLNLEKASESRQVPLMANSVFRGAYKADSANGTIIYTLNCGPVSTIRWETPNEYEARNRTK